MIRSLFKAFASIVLVVSVTGCAMNQHHQAGNGRAQLGIVMQTSNVSVASKTQEIGLAAVGGIVGTLIGNAAAKDANWRTRSAAASIGAVIGGGTANIAAKAAGMTPGQEVIVITEDRRTISIIQPLQNGEVLMSGDAVYVVTQGHVKRARRVQANDPSANAFVAGYQQGRSQVAQTTVNPVIYKSASGAVYREFKK